MNIMSERRKTLIRLVVLVRTPIIRLHALMIHLALLVLQVLMVLQVLHQAPAHGRAVDLTVAELLAVGKNK